MECPRRWMLARSTYPEVWERRGYPPRPVLPALVGSVMHQVLETILGALHAEGCASVDDPRTVDVLKGLGGYSALLHEVIEQEMQALEANPRAGQILDPLRTTLQQRVPDMRERVQTIVARASLSTGAARRRGGSPPTSRRALGPGTHPEIDLHAEDLRFVGRADLLTVEAGDCIITDYKTGSPDTHHLQQLRIYALLWRQDADLNPDRVPATRLVIAYSSHDEVHDAPTPAELDELALDLARQVTDAERQLAKRPPPARPAAEMCRLCGVRHLCDDYWPSDAAAANSPASALSSGFVDCEATIIERNGPRSWLVAPYSGNPQALLRTPSELTTFQPGDRVRMLGVAAGHDEESQTTILTMTQSSEVFVLRGT